MADPFQNVDAAGPEFIKMFADSMDVRQSSAAMERIVASYLARIAVPDGGIIAEVGAGAGAVSRRIAATFPDARVVGYEPSRGFVDDARARGKDHANLTFEVADGAGLPHEADSVDAVIMHTVLTHVVDPAPLVVEAARILKPGGSLVICDGDFSKGTFASFAHDPLDACARRFVQDFVTDAHIVGKLRGFLTDAGLSLAHFDVDSRVVQTVEQMLPWAEMSTANMVANGEIGEGLATALVDELKRRAEAGTLYGYQAFATVVGVK